MHMRYNEIVSYPRYWNSDKYPVVAHITMEAEHFSPFERLAEDQTQGCSTLVIRLH